MKSKLSLLLALSALLSSPLLWSAACENDDSGQDCNECEEAGVENAEATANSSPESCETGGNPFAIYSGNVIRRVDDLTFWNTPGEFPFKWVRTAKSRLIESPPSYFGTAHQWFHNWDVRLSDAGIDPTTGTRLIQIRHANGYTSLHRENPGATHPWAPINGNWRGQDRLYEKTIAGGDSFDGFEVQMHSGATLRFYKHNFGSGTLYRLDEVLDQLQNIYTLTYAANSAWKLTKVAAPGGAQSFDLTWGWRFGLQVIVRVDASDGRFVSYDYQEITDPEDQSTHRALFQADYSDGTYGYYRYNWQRKSYRRPLLDQARDPRVRSGARIVKYTYDSWFYGLVTSERNPTDGSVIVERVRNPNTNEVEISYGNGSTRTLGTPLGAGRVSDELSATGGLRTKQYGGYLNRALSSASDSNGEKTTYSWRDDKFLRPTRILYDDDGGTQHERRYAYTDSGLLKHEVDAPSAGGWYVTRYTRDANGHLLLTEYPDGTSESWTRNAYGDPLTHTLRNGATESWTYNTAGLKATHIGPAKAGETGATQSWTYYPSGLVDVHTLATGGTVAYEYNEVGYVTKESYGDGSYVVKKYDGTLVGGINQQFNDLTKIEKYEATGDQPDVWSFTYDNFGRKLTDADPLGHTTTYSFHDAGQGICNSCTTQQHPVSITTAEGRQTRYIYDALWRPLVTARLADGDGGDNDYEASATIYGPEGRVLHTIEGIVANNVDLTTLDFSNPLSVLPYVVNASWTSYGYDLRGRRTSVTRWEGGLPSAFGGSATPYTTTTTHDGLGNTLSETAPGNRVTSMAYAGAHVVMRQMTSRTISPDGGTTNYTTSYTWTNGELTKATDALNRDTTMTYNGRGQTLVVTYPDLSTTQSVYYVNGLLEKRIDELGRESLATYDTYGRRLTEAAPGKAASQTGYRVMALGGVDYSIDPTGVRTDYDYYDDGLRSQTIIALGTAEEAVTSYFYDDDHKLNQTIDPASMVVDMTYDRLGRKSSITVPGVTTGAADLLTTSYTYLTAQDQVVTTYPDGGTSVVVFDDLGRTVSTTNENGETIAYTYRQDTSWITTLTDARSKVTAWTYDDLGQVLTKVYPGGQEVDSYTYDAVQRMETHTRPSQRKATYVYGGRDRVTGINWSGGAGNSVIYGSGENQSFSYFDDGRPDTISNGLATTGYAYHANGDLMSLTQSHSGNTWTVGYDHDDAGRLTDLTYPAVGGNSEEVAYAYNLRGELSEVYNPDDGLTSPLATYTRRLDGLVSRLRYDNGPSGLGTFTDYHYDAGKRSTRRVHYKANGGWTDTNQYGYDTRSRRIWQKWSGNTGDRYEYDAAGQIIGVDYNVSAPDTAGGPITPDHDYTYDAMGNRTAFAVTSEGASSTVLQGNTSYATNDKNQYTEVTSPSSPPQGVYSYDPDGNLLDDGTRLYKWDAWNRLREVKEKSSGSLIAEYVYDALGHRISKETTSLAPQGAEEILFVYDDWNVIQEYKMAAGAPSLEAYLVWGNDLSNSLQGAGGVGGLLARVSSAGAIYYHYDANGNPARLTNSANNGGKYRYDAFGNVREAAGVLVADNPWQFSAKYYDQETGFSYYGFRYYDPVTGRWLRRDPIEEVGGLNLYGVVGNDPVNKWDYLGFTVITYEPELVFGDKLTEQNFKLTSAEVSGTLMVASASIIPSDSGLSANAYASIGGLDSLTLSSFFVSCDRQGNISHSQYSRSDPESGFASERGVGVGSFSIFEVRDLGDAASSDTLVVGVAARSISSFIPSYVYIPTPGGSKVLDFFTQVLGAVFSGEQVNEAVVSGEYVFKCVCVEGP